MFGDGELDVWVDESWKRARRARDLVIDQLAGRSDVAAVDVGIGTEHGSLAVRVHMSSGVAPPDLPREIDGVEILVIPGRYSPE